MRSFLLGAALIVTAQARAELLPSFDLSSAATLAAQVVVVEDGKVVEVWAGDRKVGTQLFPTQPQPPSSKIVYGFAGLRDDQIDRGLAAKGLKRVGSVSGKRLVHFLISDPPPRGFAEQIVKYPEYHTVWLEEGQAFAIQQWHNPGRADMRPLEMTEADLKQAILDLRAVDAKVQEIAKIEDRGERAAALLGLLKPGARLGNDQVQQAIRQCGKAAWPAIKAQLDDEERLAMHAELIYLAHHVARQDAQATFQAFVAAERRYFDKLDAAGAKYDRTQPPHSHHEHRRSAAQWAIDSK
jgi:hypothetical protein